MTKRYCPACLKSKPVGMFYASRGKPHGYCKPCAKSKEAARHRNHVASIFGTDEVKRRDAVRRLKLSAKPGHKVCSICLIEKKKKYFYKNNQTIESYCVPCRLTYDRKRNGTSPRSRLRTLLCAARNRARATGAPFSLTLDKLEELWESQKGQCCYSGVPLVYDGQRKPEALSIDRVDSTKGYTHDNVVLCCRRVNEMKREMSVQELRSWCLRIVTEQRKGDSNVQVLRVGAL